MHLSLEMNQPCEFINITSINPLISKCQIKVCYVSDEPNRNGTVITKEVAKEIAQSLPGSPIVGYYNEAKGDFEEHNHILQFTQDGLKMTTNTRPYGFVDLNARVWFKKYNDEGVIHEYLVTEGYIWTGQYPESQRIIDKGNNHSLEFHEENYEGTWARDNNINRKFFIINEAIISKLCILGEEIEPCFEGSQITKYTLKLGEEFENKMYSFMNSIQNMLKEKGGTSTMFTEYDVKIGDTLWNSIWDNVGKMETAYAIAGAYTDADNKNFVVLQDENDKYYRLNFSINTEDQISFSDTVTELSDYSAAPMFDSEEVAEFAKNYQAAETEEETVETEEEEEKKPEETEVEETVETEEEVTEEVIEEPEVEETEEEPEAEEDIATQYSALKDSFSKLEQRCKELETLNNQLSEFKKGIEKKEKEQMIDSFYMLSDEDKKDVRDNIDTYSLDDIEAKLSIICVRNKVSFDIDTNDSSKESTTTYNLNEVETDDVPAWVAAVRRTKNSKH